MSLHIYFEGVDTLPSEEVERDVDTFFRGVHLDGCLYDREMLSVIELAKYVDNESFVDRFGKTLGRDYLST